MKTSHADKKRSLGRIVFCLILVSLLVVGMLSLSGAAAGSATTKYDVKVVNCTTHTAALSKDTLYVWGDNTLGQFPGSTLIYSGQPVKTLSGLADVAVSENCTYVVSKAGVLTAYGADVLSGEAYSSTGRVLAKDVTSVDAGRSFVLYTTQSGALYALGKNNMGQLGNGNTSDSNTPVKIMDSGVQKVSAGRNFALALKEDGTLFGWGAAEQKEFGYVPEGELPAYIASPVQVATEVADISAGDYHSLVLKQDGSLFACGNNDFSQVGVTQAEANLPLTRVLSDVSSMTAGANHNFAVTKDGMVYAWGYGLFGRLGNGSNERIDTPTATTMDYVQLFAGESNTFAIAPNGDLASFGENTNYVLGKDEGSNELSPIRILDKDMNWIYSKNDHESEPPTPETTPNPSEQPTPTAPPDGHPVTPPEVVTTPFISGDGNGLFRPEDSITRAEFMKVLVVGLTDYDPAQDYGKASFSDVSTTAWYAPFVAYAEQNGITAGYPDGTFRPTSEITRAEASKMVAAAMNLTISDGKTTYTDVNSTHWSAPFIKALTEKEIVSGYANNLFQPTRNISRAEATKMIAVGTGFNPTDVEVEVMRQAFPSPFTDVTKESWAFPYVIRGVGYVK